MGVISYAYGGSSDASRNWDAIFGSFRRYLGPKEKIPTVLSMILKRLISCPPIASDELNILHVLNGMKNDLGCPIIYDRDIRVLKTSSRGSEVHYFEDQFHSSHSIPTHILNSDEISRCEEALNDGYSIALRGLEFRFQSIAIIADELPFFFGQPSVCVNMYLTPPNSQGLARHSGDHCVFVCQLAGLKRWAVYTRPTSQLPRLYESFDSLEDKDETEDGCREFLLKGDMLYIPRGFPHEAQTNLDGDGFGTAARFSLHLTFAIEIEPPFEWEGFMHIALYSWSEKQKTSKHVSDDPVLHNISIKLLHVAIKLLGDIDSIFRKACLIAAVTTSPITHNFLLENQEITFTNLISKITESRFSDVVQHVETTIQKNEDPLENLSWVKHLTVDFDITSQDIRYLFDLLIQQKDIAEAAFSQTKSKFCSDVKLEDVEQHYRGLLDKHRKVRKEYANGML